MTSRFADVWTVTLAALCSCSASGGDNSSNPEPSQPGGGAGRASIPGSTSPNGATSTGGTTTVPDTTASGATGTTVPPSAGAANGLPCDVSAIVQKNCATCHGSTPQFGSPLSLVRASDFAASPPGSTKSNGKRAVERINDDAHPMPPAPNARLSPADRATLQAWVDAGSPAGTCNEPGGQMASGGTGNEGTGGTLGDGGTTPADATCYTMVARASTNSAKYSVPTTPDFYTCFNYAPPWGSKKVQVVSAEPIIDNAKVIHHWILYQGSGPVKDGTNGPCAHANAAFITGWAPGGQGLRLPGDVGLRTEGGGFSLETHYNNTLGAGQLDGSGVRICVTEKLRPKEAAVHWLGTTSLNRLSASSTCKPTNTQPVNILSMSPHMHLQGRHMTTTITRKAGGTEMLLDKPFDFGNQIAYPVSAVVNPGDTLTTTCTFATPTPFGKGTNQEMCFNFVMAYPLGQLVNAGAIFQPNSCM